MIARRHDRKSPGPFRDLARYIADAREKGEKLDDLWMVNSGAGENVKELDMAIMEIEAQQAMNSRVETDKSYHLVVSFREGEKPDPEALKDIDKEFAKALGFEEHPRIVATHANTENFHMHIAYSRIHPETFKAPTPFQDFRAMEKVNRAMEKKHGLEIDVGEAEKREKNNKPLPARDKEANTWEQSFHGYVLEHKEPLMKALDESKNWQELHEAFSKYDLVIKARGNGLVIGNKATNQHTKAQHIKASALDRSFSKQALEKRFGAFQKPVQGHSKDMLAKTTRAANRIINRPIKSYKRRPLTRHKGQGKLWKRYLNGQQKKSSLVTRSFKTWKEFLTHEALGDPMAMAIIIAQKQFIKTLTKVPKDKKKEAAKDMGMEM